MLKDTRNMFKDCFEYMEHADKNRISLENYDRVSDAHTGSLIFDLTKKRVKHLTKIEDKYGLNETEKLIILTVLVWCDVAKCGNKEDREKWQKEGVNLKIHNIGSAAIYLNSVNDDKYDSMNIIIYTLILTHGLIGQAIRGEVCFSANYPIYNLIVNNTIEKESLYRIVCALNECIIFNVSDSLWYKLKGKIEDSVHSLIYNGKTKEFSIKERFDALRNNSINMGSNDYKFYNDNKKLIDYHIKPLFDNVELWYTESALTDFGFENFVKILLLCSHGILPSTKAITFEKIMNSIYVDYKDKKSINVFKMRIIEQYLNQLSLEDICNNKSGSSIHLSLQTKNISSDVAEPDFVFSLPAQKLVDFCLVASDSPVYNRAVVMLYDFLGLRHDEFDRLFNEEEYLKTMNGSIEDKRKILSFVNKGNILDVGPGGGALLDVLSEEFKGSNIYGIDFSENVINELLAKKKAQKKSWNVIKGNALALDKCTDKKFDTIIFCSVLHELFSYIETDGKKFNLDTIRMAIKSAFNILNDGGKIIIRDGINSLNNDNVKITFKDENGMNIFENYVHDFKGRKIYFLPYLFNTVCLSRNDAMEFLYTYTWGEDSYAHEVQEQFGYLNVEEWKNLLDETIGKDNYTFEAKSYLQEGYTLNLKDKIDFTDVDNNPIDLPDSNCIIVIGKK